MKMEQLSFYRGSVRGLWKKDSEMHAIEGSGNGTFLL
jgi:hypothetical protein